jgi:hypothetical protein
MIRMIAITSLIAFAVGCGGSSAADPVATPKATAVRVTEWPARNPAQPLWPASARRVQVIVTAYGTDYLVWVVSNGTNLLAVYSVPADQHDEVHARINKQAAPAMAFVQLRTSRGDDCPKSRCKTCCYVSTPPGGVVGEPPLDSGFVLATAEAMNKAILSQAL